VITERVEQVPPTFARGVLLGPRRSPRVHDQEAIGNGRGPPRLIPDVYPARESSAAIAPPAVRNSRVAPRIEYVAAVANAAK
jgi:hypothetical protein